MKNPFKKQLLKIKKRKEALKKKKPKGKSVWLNKDQLEVIKVCITEMGQAGWDYPFTDFQRHVLLEVSTKIGCALEALEENDS